jgi:hypothetical protein
MDVKVSMTQIDEHELLHTLLELNSGTVKTRFRKDR